MGIRRTSLRYGAVAICLHWLSAILIIGMFVAGIVASETDDPIRKAAILRLHAPIGLAVLGLTVVRILWWLAADRKPLPPAGQPTWQTGLSLWVHRLFYVAILGMTASGIWLMNASGAGKIIFQGSAKPMPAFETYAAFQAHSTIALVLEELFVLHVVAALYHQFIRKDRLLARMGLGR